MVEVEADDDDDVGEAETTGGTLITSASKAVLGLVFRGAAPVGQTSLPTTCCVNAERGLRRCGFGTGLANGRIRECYFA